MVSATDGDTFTGPCHIRAVKLLAGSDSATATLKVGSSIIWASGVVATTLTSPLDEVGIQVGSGDTITVNTTGTTPKVYIYLK